MIFIIQGISPPRHGMIDDTHMRKLRSVYAAIALLRASISLSILWGLLWAK